jgi:hypothetical protein
MAMVLDEFNELEITFCPLEEYPDRDLDAAALDEDQVEGGLIP